MDNRGGIYECWLNYSNGEALSSKEEYRRFCSTICIEETSSIIASAIKELSFAINRIFGITPKVVCEISGSEQYLFLKAAKEENLAKEGFKIQSFDEDKAIKILGKDDNGVLYGVFSFIRAMVTGKSLEEALLEDAPANELRIIDHWDNISGDIERGYSGKSFFYKDNEIIKDSARIKDYARILASVGINGVVINNVNVHQYETKFITEEYLPYIAAFSKEFRAYRIKTYLSVNFAAPIEIGGLATADPLAEEVKAWWRETADLIYEYIPDFGGFLVKADSEYRPGPFTYGRDHADGANMLAEALEPFGGLVIWRCFVYNCQLDWRDRSKDRAKAAYDNFKPLDGKFKDNVILQVKNGPMDFQIREAVSPLFGAMKDTNIMLEFQAAQEYTGQQKHLCYLLPMWKEVVNFDTYAKGEGSYVRKVAAGSIFHRKHGGIAAVSNLGDSQCWTGHPLAQANLYGFGRLAWNPELTSEAIAEEWSKLTFGCEEEVVKKNSFYAARIKGSL